MVQDSTTYYVWIGGSCDYGHKERAGGAGGCVKSGTFRGHVAHYLTRPYN